MGEKNLNKEKSRAKHSKEDLHLYLTTWEQRSSRGLQREMRGENWKGKEEKKEIKRRRGKENIKDDTGRLCTKKKAEIIGLRQCGLGGGAEREKIGLE